MNSLDLKCNKCGQHLDRLTESGRYLTRVSPMGTDFIGECSPACEYHNINTKGHTALLNAIEDSNPKADE